MSCSEGDTIISPRNEKYFNSDLVEIGGFIQSSVPEIGLNEKVITAQQKRAHIYWYNQQPSSYHVNDILADDVNVGQRESLVTVLDIVYDPAKKGIYNNGEISADAKNNWGGFFRLLPDSISRKFQKNNIVLKIWFRIENASNEAELNIDLGRLSEDIIPNGRLDSEDKNFNDILDNGEDTGIDGIFNLLEPAYSNNNDPNEDDFLFQYGNYEFVNGLEGNGTFWELKRAYDSEDINGNYALDINDDYYSFKVPLNINKLITNRIIEHGKNGWMQLKIPIDLPDLRVGSPDKNVIESMRLWITKAESKIKIQIAEIKFEEI